MLICPGWCGTTYVDVDTERNRQQLAWHMLNCPKARATVTLLRQYTRWLDDRIFADTENPYVVDKEFAGEWDDREKLYTKLLETFMADEPQTNPVVMY